MGWPLPGIGEKSVQPEREKAELYPPCCRKAWPMGAIVCGGGVAKKPK